MFRSFRAAVADARRHGDLYFAALLSQDRIEKAFGNARWLWQGWIYTPAMTVWVFLSQCLSPDHSCRDAVARLIAWRLARGWKPCSADTGAYCTARNDLPEEALHELVRDTRQAARSRIAGDLALARTQGSRGGWRHHHHARYAAEPSSLSPAKNAEARLRFSHRSSPGDFFALHRNGAGSGDRQIQREADRRKQFVPRTSRCVGRRRHHPRGPLFQRLVRHCLAMPARHRRRFSQAPTSPDGFPHGQAIGQRRSLGFLGAAAAAGVDVGSNNTPRCPTS